MFTDILSRVRSIRLFKKGKWNQYVAGFIASLSFGACSASYVWINPILHLLQGKDSPIPIDDIQAGLVVSIPEIACLVSPVIAGYVSDIVGRRTVILASAPIQVLAWICVFFIHTANYLFAVRVVQGLLMGAMLTVLPMYLAEIADIKTRGRMGVMSSLGWNFGILYEFVFGPFLGYYANLIVNILFPTIFFIIFFWFHESPYYLVMRNRMEEAEKALASFRDLEADNFQDELKSIKDSIAAEKKVDSSWTDLVRTKSGRKGLWVICAINVTFHMSGAMSIIALCTNTFKDMTGRELSSNLFTLGMGAVLTGVPLLTTLTIDRFGRRPTLIVSYAGSFVCLIPAMVFFILRDTAHVDVSSWVWLPIIGIVLYPTMINFGAMTVAHTYQAELFSNSTRSLASAIGTLSGSITAVLTLIAYESMEHGGQNYITYTVYTVFAALGLVFCIFSAPETSGKTFDEIQSDFNNS